MEHQQAIYGKATAFKATQCPTHLYMIFRCAKIFNNKYGKGGLDCCPCNRNIVGMVRSPGPSTTLIFAKEDHTSTKILYDWTEIKKLIYSDILLEEGWTEKIPYTC